MAYDILRKAQAEAVQILESSYRKNRLAHAYIFEGEAGTKKFDTALFFAAMLLCDGSEEHPCGQCKQCKRISHMTHPNLYVIQTTKQTIPKDTIRLLQAEFNKTAVEDGPKVYIIDDSDKMNAHASNALLKFLEEPHPDIYGILLTQNASSLLPTIRSRSQKIGFRNLDQKVIYASLIEGGFDPQLARLAAAMHHTTIEAEQFLANERLYDMIDLVKVLYEAIAEASSLVLTFEKESFGVIKSREDYQAFIDILIYYQKDCIYGKMKHYKKLIFQDQSANIEAVNQLKTKSMLIEELEHMLEFKMRISHYINERLAMDNLLILLERRKEREE